MINYPGSLDTIETLFGNLTDVATTTLNNSISSSDLVITVVDPAKFPLSRQIILIDSELVLFTSRAGNVFTVEQRGAYGTTAAAHASGARFRLIYSAAHHNTLVESIMAQQSESQYFRSPVESNTVSDPGTLSPSEGEQWIVASPAVGLWATKENKIARWKDSGWVFINPIDGMSVYVRDREGIFTWKQSEWLSVQNTEQRHNTIHTMRTGLIEGGELTISVNPAQFDLDAGSGYFIDSYTNPGVPTYKYIQWPQLLAQAVPGMATNLWTFICIDDTGTLIQSSLPPTTEDLRNKIFLGVLYHRDHTSITDISNTPSLGLYNYIEQDYIDIERIYNKSGNIYAPISGLTLQKAAGTTFGPSINYSTNRQDPNIAQDPQLNTVVFSYRSRLGVDFQEFPAGSIVDPDQYDLNGVLTLVPAGKWTTQRIYWNPSLQKTVIVYGQKIYDSQQDAVFDVTFPGVIDPELQYDSVFRCALVVQQGATDLLDQNQAQFLDANLIGSGASGSGEVNSGQNVGGGAEVYQTKMAVFLVFRTLESDSTAITITQNTDTINFNFVPSAVDHQTLSNVGVNTHADIDTFIANINTYIDPRIILRETPNVVRVRPSPNPGEFASVAAAVASITTATDTNPWIVSVAPGLYIEPTIIMKPNVSVVGHGNLSTILVASNPNDDLVVANYSCGLYDLTLTGSTGTGAALVRYNTSLVPFRTFVMDTVSLVEADIYVDIDISDSSIVSVVFANSSIAGSADNFRRGFSVKNSGAGAAILAMNAVVSNGMSGTLPEDIIVIDGTGAQVIAGNCVFPSLTPNVTNGIRVRNGGVFKATSISLENMKNGVFVENIGAASNIQCDVFIFTGCTADVRVEQPTATGYVDRPSQRSKLILDPATSVYVPGVDLQIIKVAKRGGDFTSIKDAVDSITDASSTKTYSIDVGPGIYIEDTITMKPFVSVIGAGDVETVIQADGPNKHLIVGCAQSSIRNCGLRGTSGSGYAAVYHPGTGVFASFVISRCAFGSNDTFVLNDATLAVSITRIDACRIVGPFITGFKCISGVGIFGQLVLINTTFQAVAATIADVLYAEGPDANLIIGNVLMSGVNQGNGIRLADGAIAKIIGAGIERFDKGIFVENVGAGSVVSGISIEASDCTTDVQIDHPGTTGFLTGSFSRSKVVDAPSAVVFTYSDPNSGSFTTTGEFFLGPSSNEAVEVSQLFIEAPAMGLLQGGQLSDGGGFTVNVTAGVGYTSDSGLLQKIEWNNDSILLPANSASYIYYNSNGILSAAAGFPDTKTNILLGRVITNSTGIEIMDLTPFIAEHASNRLDVFARQGLGVVYESGSIVTATPSRELDVSSGLYFFSGNPFEPSGGLAVTLRTHYRDGLGGFIRGNATVVDNANYDDGTGTLAPLTAGYYAKHSIYTVGQGVNEKYLLVYSQAEYLNLTVAEQATLPTPPTYFNEGIVLIASVIVQEGMATIVQVRDERPVLGYKASGVSASSDHGNLLGLADDDHLQYFRADGGRTMSGNINMGGNSITNVNLVDGVDVSAHASRHQPNGADPIPTAAAVGVLPNNVNGVGTSNSLSRADHTHALPSGTPVTQTPDQANAAGTANNVARADHVHNIPAAAPATQTPETGNIKGVAASFALSDHQHNIPTDAPTSNLTASTTNAEGVGASFARNDHSHAITTGTPVTQAPDQLNAPGTAAELARADHVHNIPADAPTTPLSPATTNAEGSGSAFARNDHTHAVATALAANITTIQPDATADAGTSDTFARGDHRHAIVTDAPTTPLSATTTDAEGVGTSFARNDHTHSILTGTPSSITPDQANAAGTSANLARADHIHNIPADAPIANLTASTTNAEGVGAAFARNDHSHAITTGAATTQNPDQVNATGTSASLARADHVHNIPTAAAVGVNANSANGQGVSTSFSRADHTHAIATGTPSTQNPDQVNAVGTSANLARADHIHNIPTAAPIAALQTNSTNAQGVGTSFARNDHSHASSMAILADITTILPDDTAATGSSTRFAFADHRHAIAAAAPTTNLTATTTNAEGVGTSFARNDHTHAVDTGSAVSQTPDQANAAGTSANLARADHIHNIPTAAPVNTGSANSQGVSSSFARADHVHNTVLANSIATATALAQTTSATDTLLTTMTLTPPSGTYLVNFSSSTVNSGNGAERNFFTLYVDGVARTHTQKRIGIAGGATADVDISDIVTVNGSQAIEIRWRVAGGTGSTYERTLTAVRIGS